MFCTIAPLAACIKPVLAEALLAAQGSDPYAVTNAVEKMLEIEKRLKNLKHMETLASAAADMAKKRYYP